MEYYHELVTQKSWEELCKLKKLVDFVLIGGWATFLYTKTLKSKDIDIIIDYNALSKINEIYSTTKNQRLNKYEAIKGEVQIDIYLPHYSQIGIPIEDLLDKTTNVEGFTLLDSNYLFTLKLYTLQQRGRTTKGRKDFIDIMALINSKNISWEEVLKIVMRYNLRESLKIFSNFLNETYEINDLAINKHKFSQLKKEILKNIL